MIPFFHDVFNNIGVPIMLDELSLKTTVSIYIYILYLIYQDKAWTYKSTFLFDSIIIFNLLDSERWM